MPAPPASLMSMTAKTTFASKGLIVPPNWRKPTGDAARHYEDAFKPEEKITTPATAAPLLFRAASLNKYHTDAQKMNIATITSVIDGVTAAVTSAVATCQQTCTMTGITIPSGPIGVGGQMICPTPMGATILGSAPKSSPQALKYSKAIADAFDVQWKAFIASIKIPGLPLWPMLAVFASPAAVQIPNVPVPLVTLTHAPIKGSVLKTQMMANLNDPKAPFCNELFESLGQGIEAWFEAWLAGTLVTNVMANGPVPSMTTPTPVPGPVTGGVATMMPGGLT